MSLELCNKKLRYLSSQHSFSSAKDVINDNFSSLVSCMENVQTQIVEIQNITEQFFPIIFPDNPNPTVEYNLIYSNGKYFLTQATNGGVGGGNDKYWLVSGEQLTIKSRSQHIVLNDMIIDAGAELVIEPTGSLVIL